LKNKIILLLVCLSSFSVFADSDIELARLYVDEAFYYYERENYTSADEYLQTAMEFSEDIPESWYLSGLIREEQGNRLKALDLYRQSIIIGDEHSDYYYDLYYRFLNLLNITAHHEDVLNFYSENRKIFDRDNEIILKVADSAFKFGLIDYSQELASDVFKRNPHNLKSLLYLIRSTGDHKYFRIIEKSLYHLETDKLDEVLFQELILSNRETAGENPIELYKAIFGETPFYSMLTGVDEELIDKSRNLMIRSLGDEILEDGVYFGDYNFDGISDEIVSVSGSELTYLKDGNQDNITDLSINFTNGIPSGVFLNKGETGYEFKYSEYPYVEEIHYIKKNLTRIYKIFPGTVYTPLFDLPSFDWKYNKNRKSLIEDFNLNLQDLLTMSYLFEEYFSGNKNIFREYSLKDGEVTGIKEDSRNAGVFNHYLDISAWQPVSGKRDLNLDGIIDIYEHYEDGKITGIAVDWNNNGKSEYLEDWSVLDIKTWDFNEDSYSDAEYISSRSGDIYKSVPIEKDIVSYYDIYSWDFTFEKFWFNNN